MASIVVVNAIFADLFVRYNFGMSATLRYLLVFLREPEWVAAIALLIQAGILLLQAAILRKHGETMEKHAEIAKGQSETAALIGKALDQQGKILDEQTKIMDEQFKFQRATMAQADRQQVFAALVALRNSMHMLIAKIEEPGERYPPRLAEEQRMQAALLTHMLPLQNAFISSVHLTPEEKDYFGRYSVDVFDAVSGDVNFPARLPKMKQVQQKYSESEFIKMAGRIGKPSI
ncbi:MAG: hypothetical protein WB421_04340 [Terriglobales bacterium]